MTIPELYKIFKNSAGVTTDSRKIHEGEIFFALKGENFDGNAYAVKALEEGASYAVIDRESDTAKEMQKCTQEIAARLIPVEDTLKTLQDLARWHRSMTFVNGKPLPVIGLTGTNGKTTTKELIKTVLSAKYKVTATEGNLNNSIGVPLSLLKINEETEIAVIEMGASHPGDISELVSICLPNYGIITNVGKAHLLGFGSFEGVKKAKGELYDYIQRTADKAFINADNQILCKMAEERPDLQLIPYGLNFQGAEIMTADGLHPYLRIALKKEGTVINTHLIGSYNADNVMAALAVGRYFGIPEEDAVKAVSGYVPKNSRSQMMKTAANVLIVDAYNANPTSMAAALDNLDSIDAGRKAVMLGNMLELGDDSVKEHIAVIERLSHISSLEYAVLVGDEFRKALDAMGDAVPDNVSWFATSDEAASGLSRRRPEGCCILVKGSRGSMMEKVIPSL